MLKYFLTIICLLMAIPVAARAGTIKLPRTGQNTCYSPKGIVIACDNTGQDGETQAGVAWPSPAIPTTWTERSPTT